MKLGQRVNNLGAQLVVADPGAGAIDYGRPVVSQGKGGHGKHGATSVAPTRRELSLAEQFAAAIDRVCVVFERELEHARRGADARPAVHDRSSEAYRESTRRITSRAYEGDDPTRVAFLEFRTTEGVRKLRIRAGLDPEDGTRPKREPVLTDARARMRAERSCESDTPKTED